MRIISRRERLGIFLQKKLPGFVSIVEIDLEPKINIECIVIQVVKEKHIVIEK
jgi:hypothetical protein